MMIFNMHFESCYKKEVGSHCLPWNHSYIMFIMADRSHCYGYCKTTLGSLFSLKIIIMYKKGLILIGCLFIIGVLSAQNSKTAVDFYNEGIQLKDEEKYKEAAAAFAKAIQKKPDYKDALYEIGWCLNEVEEYKLSITHLQNASRLSPAETKVLFELGYAFEKNKDKQNATKYFKKVLALSPTYYSAYMHMGDIYYHAEQYDTALNNYVQYFKTDTITNSYYYKAGWCANDLGKYTDAIGYLAKYEPTEAADKVKKFSETGFAHYKLEQNEQAIIAYKKALEIDPDYLLAIKGLGNVYFNTAQDYKAALELFERVLQQDEANSKLYYYKLGWLYNDVERYNDAAKMLVKAIAFDSKDDSYREELGYTYYMLGSYDDAFKQLRKAVELNPKSKMGYYYQGLCYIALSQNKEARSIYEKLKTIDAEQAEKLQKKIKVN